MGSRNTLRFSPLIVNVERKISEVREKRVKD